MKKLLQKLSLVALLVVAVVVTVGCGEEKAKYTVTYFDIDNPTQAIGSVEVVEGKIADKEVNGWVLATGEKLYTEAECVNEFKDGVSSNVSLYGQFLSPAEGAQYTYQSSFSLSPATFNPFQYRSTTDSVPLDYTTLGFYGFGYNAEETGFELKPVMAAADPVDVTSLYATADWGLEGKTSGYAFRVALNKDAKWENGEAITADDYIYSMKALLDPEFQNYRASNYYAGTNAIYGAKDYFYSGQTTYLSAVEIVGDTQEGFDGLYFDATNVPALSPLFGESDMTKLSAYRGYFAVGETNYYEELVKYAGEDRVPFNEELFTIWKNIMTKGLLSGYWVWADEELPYFSVAQTTFPEYSWDNVGVIKVDDYTVDIIYTTSLAGFYIKYSVGLPLVNETLYEKCKKFDEATQTWSSSYGTSVDTYMGYGPYKMTKYVVDQLMVFERNENWFGYSEAYADEYGKFVAEFDGKEHQQYQTTKITLRYVPEISTREQMFLAGQLDGFGMNREYYDKYKSSIRLYNATGASTFYGIILSDYTSLVEREAVLNGVTYDSATYENVEKKFNKTILTIKEFRQALCYALDRKTLVANLYPGGSPATSLYSNLIIADPDNGISFNSFDSTKAAICKFWGVEYGEGKEFETLEEAYKAISGFDLASAKKLVDVAYDKAIEQGLMTASSIVKIDYCGSTDSETEQMWYNTFNNCLVELFKGTKLEGKFEYVYNTNLGSDFGGAIQSGLADTAWGFGWSGGELDPYSLFQVYVDAADSSDPYQYDKWINRNTEAYNITLNVDLGDGVKEHTYTAYEWFTILNGIHEPAEGETAYDCSYAQQVAGVVSGETRAEILAAMELAVLLDYTHIPMMNQGSVSLLSYKVNYGKEEYMFGMGFGGLRYITYNYTDSQWAKYVASQEGGNLSY